MADRTLTINHADGGSETYTIKRDKFAGVREMSIDGSTVTVDRTAVPKEQSKETTFGGSQSITIKREIEPLLSEVVGGASAAYSLRDLNDKAGNNKVVRVRRSSDNAEADFKAKEVSDGTLVDWVNTNNNGVFANEGFEAFSGASESGFTAHNSIENSAATTTASSGSTGDVVVASFDLDISEGSPALSLRTFSTGGALASNFVVYTESGNYTATFTATTTFRAVGFTEGDAPSSFTVSNFKILNDAFVETWYDQSGNGNDAVHETASYQPKIVDAGVLVSGGIDFDGTQKLEKLFPSGVSGKYQSLFVKFTPNSNLGYLVEVGGGIGAARSLSVEPYLRFNVVTQDYDSTILSGDSLLSMVCPDAPTTIDGYELYYQGSLLTPDSLSGGTLANVTSSDITIGDGAYIGKISEAILYSSDQSANRVAIETNINNQYDIY